MKDWDEMSEREKKDFRYTEAQKTFKTLEEAFKDALESSESWYDRAERRANLPPDPAWEITHREGCVVTARCRIAHASYYDIDVFMSPAGVLGVLRHISEKGAHGIDSWGVRELTMTLYDELEKRGHIDGPWCNAREQKTSNREDLSHA